MSLLKVNEVQNYNGSSLTLTASTVSTSAQLNTGGNISVTGSINVSDDSTTRSNLGLGSIATQDSSNVTITGGNISNATLASSVVGSIQGFELYQLSSDITADGLITGFTLKTAAPFSVKGDLIEESSGIITFNSTGIYLIQGAFHISTTLTSNDTVVIYTKTTTDGSTYQAVGYEQHRDQASVNANGPSHNKIPTFTIINCTDTSLVKLKYDAVSISSGTAIKSDALTTIIVIKIG